MDAKRGMPLSASILASPTGESPTGSGISSPGIADNSTSNEITQLQLVLAVEGIMLPWDMVLFDDLNVEYWFPPPIPSPLPSNVDTDGFPAQALHVYWVLRNNGYTNDNVFLMLYHISKLFAILGPPMIIGSISSGDTFSFLGLITSLDLYFQEASKRLNMDKSMLMAMETMGSSIKGFVKRKNTPP